MERNTNNNWFSINPLDLDPTDNSFCPEDSEFGEYNDVFLLSAEELEKLREKKREKKRREKEKPALLWLAKEIIMVKPEKLVEALTEVRDGVPYKTYFKNKKSGGKRKIQVPSEQLKAIQRKINRNILKFQLKTPNVFGFSGGNIDDAIKPHLKAKSVFMVDVKDAFPSIVEHEVFDFFIEGREALYQDWRREWLPFKTGYSKLVEFEPGYMSWYAARIVTQLTTYQGRLPQGAPTSPRLFDLLFKRVDVKLTDFADNAGGHYTRYADNIFFSTNEEEFPGKVKNGILRRIRRCGFIPHKIKTEQLSSKPVRMLGLNIIDQKVCNTRDFKRRLRLMIHHCGWMLDHEGCDTEGFKTAFAKLQGYMAFARADTLPQKLLGDYAVLQARLFP